MPQVLSHLFASGQVLNLSEHQFSRLRNGDNSFSSRQGINALKVKEMADWKCLGDFVNWVSNALQTKYEDLGREIEVSGDSS